MNSLATVKLDGGSMDQVGLTAKELITQEDLEGPSLLGLKY